MITSSLPFAPISWWMAAISYKYITIDLSERYEKMSYRNRYCLSGPQGKVLMSIPLEGGRNQKTQMKDVLISYTDNWQERHWKTLCSIYQRSPYFEYLKTPFSQLYHSEVQELHEWNLKGMELINTLLGLGLTFNITYEYIKEYPSPILDYRKLVRKPNSSLGDLPIYSQVFSDRTGFIPDCSILDLIFCEGIHLNSFLNR